MRRVGVGSRIASEVGRVEIVFSGEADQSEERIPAGVGQRGPPSGAGPPSRWTRTGHSDYSHSPDECARTVVSLINPASLSIAVVWAVAISCAPSDLRTISSPVESAA
jgi:hypothetical protein